MTNDCATAGGHFNPHNKDHGGPKTNGSRHVGDLGNVVADEKGTAYFVLIDSQISLIDGVPNKSNIIGRSFVIHEKADDLGMGGTDDSKTTGAAGSRLACGIIETSDGFNDLMYTDF